MNLNTHRSRGVGCRVLVPPLPCPLGKSGRDLTPTPDKGDKTFAYKCRSLLFSLEGIFGI